MFQQAPDPTELFDLVRRIKYKPGWEIELIDNYDRGNGSVGLTLIITCWTINSRHQTSSFGVRNYFIVPAATYNMKSWRRWIFECYGKVEDHERAEFFMDGDERPFAPLHGPGNDPYFIRELSTDEEVRTDQCGNIQE